MYLGSIFKRHSKYRPNHLAVIFKDDRLDYKTLNDQINRTANAFLGQGLKKGDKIATFLPNSLELLEIYWAVSKIGAVVVPMSTLLLQKALTSLLNDSEAVMVVTNKQFSNLFEK